MKILILKPSSLGDVVQALPVLRLLKCHLPDSEIYWWIESSLAPLLEGDPDLTGVVPFERRRWAAPQHWPELWRNLQWAREQSFDWVIDLQSLARSGTVAWLANGALTIGLDEPREGARGYYDLIVQRPSFYTHAVDWYLEVLRILGVPVHWNFSWLPLRDHAAENIARKWPVRDAHWIIIQPGARWSNKRWPAEHFARLVVLAKAAQPELRFAILGAESDRTLGQTIAAVAPENCVDLTGELSLPEMIEWIRLSALMLTNDTGPMHVAAALGKPILALFGPTEPRRTGPYRQLDGVLRKPLPCAPCLKPYCTFRQPLECLVGLSPAEVWQAVQKRFGHVRSR